MFLLRLLAILSIISVAGGVGAYFLTHDPKYLRFAWQVFRYTIIVALLFFGLLIAERVLVIPA